MFFQYLKNWQDDFWFQIFSPLRYIIEVIPERMADNPHTKSFSAQFSSSVEHFFGRMNRNWILNYPDQSFPVICFRSTSFWLHLFIRISVLKVTVNIFSQSCYISYCKQFFSIFLYNLQWSLWVEYINP